MKFIVNLLFIITLICCAIKVQAQTPPLIPNETSGPGCPSDITQCAGYKLRTDINNRLSGSVPIVPQILSVTFAQLPASATNGTIYTCTDCQQNLVCTGGGTTGAIATRLNGQWSCNTPIAASSVGGDCIFTSPNIFTCTKTGGLPFGPFATSTNAANLSGTLGTAQLPALIGDVTSTPNTNVTVVNQIQGRPISPLAYQAIPCLAAQGCTGNSTTPLSGQLLVGNVGSAYTPQTLSGDASLTSTGALTITKTNGTAFTGAATMPLPVSVANGGTGTGTPAGTAGAGLAVSGSFPNQQYSLSTPVSVSNGGTGTGTPAGTAGAGLAVSGSFPNQQYSLSTPVSAINGGTGSSTNPLSAQIPIAGAGNSYVPQTLSGDATLSNLGALTITKTNGTTFTGAATMPLPVSVANGGTGTGTPAGTAGTGLAVSGSFPNQQYSLSTPVSVSNGGTGTGTPAGTAGTGLAVSGSFPNQQYSMNVPVSVSNGGTQCGAPTTVAGLPATPTQGEICNVTDSTSCAAGTAVTGGSTLKCQVTWNGTSWLPAGGAVGAGGFTTAGSGLTGSGATVSLTAPVTVANGGTQCGAPTIFSGLPGLPTNGEICTVTDAISCNIATAVTIGGGSINCRVTYNGANWMPSAGVTANTIAMNTPFTVGNSGLVVHTTNTLVISTASLAAVQGTDVEFASYGYQGAVTITLPTGWIKVRSDCTSTNCSEIDYHIVGSSEPTSYTWTSSSSPNQWSGLVANFRNVNIANPIDKNNGTNTAGAIFTLPALSPTTLGELALLNISSSNNFIFTPTPNGLQTIATCGCVGAWGGALATYPIFNQSGISITGEYYSVGGSLFAVSQVLVNGSTSTSTTIASAGSSNGFQSLNAPNNNGSNNINGYSINNKFNVVDYGASSDGYHDAAIGVQLAINAANTAASSLPGNTPIPMPQVYFPSNGKYLFTRPVIVQSAGTGIDIGGDSQYSSLITYKTNGVGGTYGPAFVVEPSSAISSLNNGIITAAPLATGAGQSLYWASTAVPFTLDLDQIMRQISLTPLNGLGALDIRFFAKTGAVSSEPSGDGATHLFTSDGKLDGTNCGFSGVFGSAWTCNGAANIVIDSNKALRYRANIGGTLVEVHSANNAWTLNVTHEVEAVFDGNNVCLFLDGTRVGTSAQVGTITQRADEDMLIGADAQFFPLGSFMGRIWYSAPAYLDSLEIRKAIPTGRTCANASYTADTTKFTGDTNSLLLLNFDNLLNISGAATTTSPALISADYFNGINMSASVGTAAQGAWLSVRNEGLVSGPAARIHDLNITGGGVGIYVTDSQSLQLDNLILAGQYAGLLTSNTSFNTESSNIIFNSSVLAGAIITNSSGISKVFDWQFGTTACGWSCLILGSASSGTFNGIYVAPTASTVWPLIINEQGVAANSLSIVDYNVDAENGGSEGALFAEGPFALTLTDNNLVSLGTTPLITLGPNSNSTQSGYSITINGGTANLGTLAPEVINQLGSNFFAGATPQVTVNNLMFTTTGNLVNTPPNNIPWSNNASLVSVIPYTFTNASNLSTGTISASRMPALTGDCTTNVGTVATNCLKTNGAAFTGAATMPLPVSISNGGTGTGTPAGTAGAGLAVSGSFPNQQYSLSTPVSVSNGGTQCGAPTTVAGLPATPTQGEICNVTDSTGCSAGTAVTGGGTTKCQVTWNGTSWLPAGGATSASAAGFSIAGNGLTGSGATVSLTAPVTVANGGTGTITAPLSAQLLVGNSGGTAYVPQTLSGDATLSNLGALTVTKTNGTAFTGAATMPLPVSVANGGTQCGAPTTFLNLPATPTQGEICNVTDAVSCTVGTSVAGGGTVKCQVTWNGTNWLPAGGAVSGAVGLTNANAYFSITNPVSPASPTCSTGAAETYYSYSISSNLTINLNTTSCSAGQDLVLIYKQTAAGLTITYSTTGVNVNWLSNCNSSGSCTQPGLSGNTRTDAFKFTYDTLPTTPEFKETTQNLNITPNVIVNPMTTIGDTIYGGTTGSPLRLGGNTNSWPQEYYSQGAAGVAQAPALAVIPPFDLLSNDATNPPVLNKLAKATSTGTIAIATTADTTGVLGACIYNCGTSGQNAGIVTTGNTQLITDGAITQNDYFIASATTGGLIHDTGSSSCPSTGQVLGKITAPTNAAPGTTPQNVILQAGLCNTGGGGGGTSYAYHSATNPVSPQTPTCDVNVAHTYYSYWINANLTLNMGTTTCAAGQDIVFIFHQTVTSLAITYSTTGVAMNYLANCNSAGSCTQPTLSGSGDTDTFKFTYDNNPSLTTPEFKEIGQDLNIPPPLAIVNGGTGLTTTTSGGVLGSTSAGVAAWSGALTANGIVYGGGAGAVPASTGACANGAVPIGSGSGPPICSTITAGSNITITNAPNSITIASSGGGGGGNTCTDNPASGTWTPTWTAGHTYCLTSGTYTLTAAQNVNVNNVTVLCTSKAAIITRNSAADMFDVSGNSFDIEGCTLDGASLTSAGTGPILNLTGNDAVVRNNYFQNTGTTASTQTGTIWVQKGLRHKIIDNTVLTAQTDVFAWVNSQTGTNTVQDLTIAGNKIPNFAPITSLYAIDVNQVSGNADLHIKIDDNIITQATATANCIAWHGPVVNENTSLIGSEVDRNHCYVSSASAPVRQIHLFGFDYGTVADNILDDGGVGVQGSLLDLADFYNVAVTGNMLSVRGALEGGIACVDCSQDTFTGNTIDGVANGTNALYIGSSSGTTSNNTINGNTIRMNTTGAGIEVQSNTASFVTTNNTITGNDIIASAPQTGETAIKILDSSGTLDSTSIFGNMMQGFTGTSDICISIGSGANHTYVGQNNLQGCTTSTSNLGNNTSGNLWTGVASVTLSGLTPSTATFTAPVPCNQVFGLCENTTNANTTHLCTLTAASTSTTTCTITVTGGATFADHCTCFAQLY